MTAGQKKGLEEQWATYGLSTDEGAVDPRGCFKNIKRIKGQVIIEIGFGMGDSLYETACLYPDNNYIGIETHRPGIGHLIQLAATAGIENLRVFRDDAVDVLTNNILPDSIDLVQVFFPDPWPKKRHHKRRLVNGAFIKLIASRIKIGGRIHMATDWDDYARSIKSAAESNPDLQTCDPEKRVKTKYENRGKALGHEIVDLGYVRIR